MEMMGSRQDMEAEPNYNREDDDDNDKSNTKKKRLQYCTFCKNHCSVARKKNHVCPYKACQCPLCVLQRKAQITMRHQQRIWRHQKHKLHRFLSREQEPTNPMDEKGQMCDKCRNHNELVMKKNHQCPYSKCKCQYCSLTFKRRELMKHLQRVRRSNLTCAPPIGDTASGERQNVKLVVTPTVCSSDSPEPHEMELDSQEALKDETHNSTEKCLNYKSKESSCLPQYTVQNINADKNISTVPSVMIKKKTTSFSPLNSNMVSNVNQSTFSLCDSHCTSLKWTSSVTDKEFACQASLCLTDKDLRDKEPRVCTKSTKSIGERKIFAGSTSEIVSDYIDLSGQHSGSSLQSVGNVILASTTQTSDNASRNDSVSIFPTTIDQAELAYRSANNKSNQPPQSSCSTQNLPQDSLSDPSLCTSSSAIYGIFKQKKEKYNSYENHSIIPKMRIKYALKIPNFDKS